MARATITRKIQVAAAPAPGEPLWRQGQSVNAWREIEGSSLSLCPPTVNPGGIVGPSSKLNAWCGLSIDTRTSTVWAPGNGGHDDYHGNEVNSICLEDDAPAWVENLASTTGFTSPNNGPRYSDGSPVSIHGYYSQQFIESRDMAMRFGLAGGATAGNSFGEIDGYSLTTEQWSGAEDFPSWAAFDPDLPVVKDPATEDVYCFRNNNNVYKWTNATNSVETLTTNLPGTMIKAACAFDPVRSRIFIANPSGSWTFDPSAKSFTGRTLTGAVAAGVLTEQNGMIYEPTLDSFLVLRNVSANNVAVYRVDAETFEVVEVVTTGGPVPCGGTSATRPYSKFLYAPNLGGCIYFPLYNENGWFLRTH